MAEQVSDPETLTAIDAAPASEKVTDPALLAQLEGSEPRVSERFLSGMTKPAVAAGEFIAPFLPKGPKQAEAAPPGKSERIPEKKKSDDFDWVELAGSMAGSAPVGLGVGAAISKFATTMPKLAQSGVVGGLMGLMEPTGKSINEPGFAQEKFIQGAEGIGLGFGFHAGGKALGKGMNVVMDFMAKNKPDFIQDKAAQILLARINREIKAGGLTAEQALEVVQEAYKGGQPLTLGDVYGKPVRDLAGRIYRQGGDAKATIDRTLEQRDVGLPRSMGREQHSMYPLAPEEMSAGQRLDRGVAQHISSGQTAYQATKMLNESQKAAAAPLYEEMNKTKVVYVNDDLQRLLNMDDIKEAFRLGFKIEEREAASEKRPFSATMLGIEFDVDGNIKFNGLPNMRVLDIAKGGLDAIIGKHIDNFGRMSREGRSFVKLKNAYLAELDAMDTTGSYKRARQAWAGPEANKNAVALGKRALDPSYSPEEMADDFARLSIGEQEFFKVGVADRVREGLQKSGFSADESKAVIRNEWMERQLSTVFKTNKDFDKFFNIIEREREMFQFKSDVKGGSQTAERVAADVAPENLKIRAADLAYSLIKHPWHALAQFYRFHREMGLRPDPKLNEQVAKIIFSPGGPDQAMANRLTSPTPRRKLRDFSPYPASLSGMLSPDLRDEQ